MPIQTSGSLQYLIDAVSGIVQINIPALNAGYFPRDNTGTVVCFKGKKAVVFSFHVQKQSKAIKIWPGATNEYRRGHYAVAEKFLDKSGLDYFVKTFYLKDAISLGNGNYDALLMEWVERQNIKDYIYSHLDQKEQLNALAEKILIMHKALNRAGISHGRLHAGSIYIDANGNLKLIGYDTLFILGETGYETEDEGYPDYCHPSGKQHGIKADYFAALILYLGIKAIAHDAVLWGRYKAGFQEGFLFQATDFPDIKNATLYKYLRKIQSPEIDRLLDILVIYCAEPDATSLNPFYNYLEKGSALPKNLYEQYTGVVVLLPAADGLPKTYEENTRPGETAVTALSENVSATAIGFTDVQPVGAAQGPAENIQVVAGRSNENKLSRKNQGRGGARMQADAETTIKRKKKFWAGAVVICLLILAAGYFLGDLADSANTLPFQPQDEAREPKNELPAKPALVQTQTKVSKTAAQESVVTPPDKKNSPAVADAKDKPLPATKPPETIAVNSNPVIATVKSVPATVNATTLSNTTAIKINKGPVDLVAANKSNIMAVTDKNGADTAAEKAGSSSPDADKKLAVHPGNTSAAGAPVATVVNNYTRKPVKKMTSTAKLHNDSFKIGSPPKE